MGVSKAALESVGRYLARDLGAARRAREPRGRRAGRHAGGRRHPRVRAAGLDVGPPGAARLGPRGPGPGGRRGLLPALRPLAARSTARSSTWTAASTRWAPRSSSRYRAVLLAIDVGNTQTHVGMFDGERAGGALALRHRALRHRRRAATRMAACCAARPGLKDVDAAIVSSVVPSLAHEYDQLIERYLAGSGCCVGPWLKTGMPIRIDNPPELGADRLVNAVAAYDRVGAAVHRGRLRHGDQLRRRLGRGRVPGRRDLARDRDLARGAGGPGRAAAPGGHRGPAPRDRKGTARRSSRAWSTATPARWTHLGRLREELGEEATAIATGGFAAADRPLLRAGRRGRRPADPDRPEAGLRAQHSASRRAWVAHLRVRAFDAGATARASPTPGRSAATSSPTASCSRRSRASATGSCAFRQSATARAS